MSHVAYDLQLNEAMNDLQEQVKVEHVPTDLNRDGRPNADTWTSDAEWFQHHACLYIKYVDIYRKLEDCYDQMVHPQKRADIKRIVESTMLRIVEIKSLMSECYPTRKGTMYIHLDQLLFDLKYDPSVIEIPVPRYFKDIQDRIPVDIKFSTIAMNRKKEKPKKKGKKKKANDDDEKEEKLTLAKQMDEVKRAYKDTIKVDKPDVFEEHVHDVFTIDMTADYAIRVLQTNERGRQGVGRVQ